ncbi:MAG: MauE/DoxX family redox-associated membrane protein [Pseudomonadota bacterium]
MDTARNHWRLWVPRLLAGAVGLILLTAGLLKATDMELFIGQIRDYGIISQHIVLTLSAWGLIAMECALGVGLLVFYRPRLILSLTAMLLLVFVGANSWAWLTGATEDCGCFGAWLKRTPEEAVLGNLMLLAATVLAWVGCRHSEEPQTRAKAWAVRTACLIGLMLPVAFGFTTSRISQPQWKEVEIELSQLQIRGLHNMDLGHGAYLIILMDTECLHCQEAVPELNRLAQETDLPPVIALCENEERQRMMFVEEFQAIFPIGQVREDVFWRLIADGNIPRIILVRDGRVQQVWDQKVPDKGRIKSEHSLSKSEGTLDS